MSHRLDAYRATVCLPSVKFVKQETGGEQEEQLNGKVKGKAKRNKCKKKGENELGKQEGEAQK